MSYGRQLFFAGVLVAAWLLLAHALSGVAHAPGVSMDQARAAALARVDGTIVAQRYERESEQWVYTFDIRPRDDEDAVFVTVDADRGGVIQVHSGRFVAHNAR